MQFSKMILLCTAVCELYSCTQTQSSARVQFTSGVQGLRESRTCSKQETNRNYCSDCGHLHFSDSYWFLQLAKVLVLVWLLEFLEALASQGASKSCDDPPAWTLVLRTVPVRFQRAGALENVAEPDRPSGSEELPPAKTLRVSPTNENRPFVGQSSASGNFSGDVHYR